MKRLLKIAVLVITIAGILGVGNLQAQDVPPGKYVAQPFFPSDGSVSITVNWISNTVNIGRFQAELSSQGPVTNMWLSLDGGCFSLNAKKGDECGKFSTPLPWKRFAQEIRSQYQKVGDPEGDLFVEVNQYEFVGLSMIMGQSELNESKQALVFKRGETVLSIPRPSWKGYLPKEKSLIFIGRDERGDVFFPATSTSQGFKITPEMATYLASEKEANRK